MNTYACVYICANMLVFVNAEYDVMYLSLALVHTYTHNLLHTQPHTRTS